MIYHDKYGRIHNKPVTESNPYPCNNAWLYTAYYGEVTEKYMPVYEAYEDCTQTGVLYRNPLQATPPVSRDEVLGLVYLGYLGCLTRNGWDFSPYRIPPCNFFKLVSQLWEARNQHRNYFWENKLDQIYRFAFSVPIQDRYFILEINKEFKWYKPSHLFYKAVAYFDSKGSPSGLRYLKYGGEANKKAMLEEFPEDHPIRKL